MRALNSNIKQKCFNISLDAGEQVKYAYDLQYFRSRISLRYRILFCYSYPKRANFVGPSLNLKKNTDCFLTFIKMSESNNFFQSSIKNILCQISKFFKNQIFLSLGIPQRL